MNQHTVLRQYEPDSDSKSQGSGLKRFATVTLVIGLIGVALGFGYRLGHGNWPLPGFLPVQLAAALNGSDAVNGTAAPEKTKAGGASAEPARPAEGAATEKRAVLYYRNPMGLPDTSKTPKKDSMGMAYIPVYKDEQAGASNGLGKILYYRNPMGLPDTSPVPKKDSMGMAYIPVHEKEGDDGATVKVSPQRIQMSGVRTETVEKRRIMEPVRAPGILKVDESRLHVVSMRAESFIEKLYVDRTGQSVREGQPLFRVYSPQITRAEVDSRIALGGDLSGRGTLPDSAVVRLRNLDVPDKTIRQILSNGNLPRSIDWPSPVSGVVLEKKVVAGQRMAAGEELYRIADISVMWVIADVPEGDLGRIRIGDPATIKVRAFPGQDRQGRVDFIYPELNAQTRTARVRIVVPNKDGRLLAEMYADVTIEAGQNQQPVVAVPKSALIDNGKSQVVLVAKGEGRFEPREVELGRRGDDFVEVRKGLKPGESIVSTGSFLIDAESNIKSALQTFTAGQESKP